MTIDFDTNADVAGMGRVIVNGRYYGLPVAAVRVLEEAARHLNLHSEKPMTAIQEIS